MCLALSLSLFLGANAPAAKAEEQPQIQIDDGVTQPVFSYQDAIRETVSIEAPMDSDGDGRRDRISADVIRPKETETGLKVPVIYEMSPYRAGLNNISFHDVDTELNPVKPGKGDRRGKPSDQGWTPASSGTQTATRTGDDSPRPFPGYYDNYFVPRGYAVVLAEGPGTGQSEGCPTSGGENEVIATRAVIDWLNGRAKAFNEDGKPVSADWSTGDTGMIGVSYNGTLPNAVAATGVEGLKTIVPIAAINSWYDYYRANGAVVAPGGYQGEDTDVLAKAVLTRDHPEVCTDVIDSLQNKQDRPSGDYSSFWAERDYVKNAGNVRASVFAVHGLNDWNVKTKHVARWWDTLSRQKVPRKIWLHQGGHQNPFSFRHDEWLTTLNRWFDHWLYDIDNGIMKEPMADIERAAGEWETHRNWPDEKARPTLFHLETGHNEGAGTLSLHPGHGHPGDTEDLIDNPEQTAEQLTADPQSTSPNRLVYLTPELKQPVRLSGTAKLNIRASIDQPAANLTALLVDYGTDTRVDYEAGLENTGRRICYGEGVPGDDGCTYLYKHKTHRAPFEIVTRGWMDPQNRQSASRSKPVVPGREYSFRWDMQAEDYVFKPGHRIGIVLIASDHDYTLRPSGGTTITVTPGQSRITLPIVDGRRAFKP
ncbi:Xaa-Pro dipeptidyl-peptidase [Paludifilum halophilum]|uniref:Xaa-Pro dipeptidyl-peptidase n=1 Tax=Paludifilum halophilum TaxID=1642702 RepID=UPI001F0AEB7A|nr:Xaa-Pro dipeptidyl-peptidase [Paludifilum halophilum]